jgi:chemotaxis protein methyltransferase CheR
MSFQSGVTFLQWALPKMGYQWDGFRKPRGQVLKRIRKRMQELELSGGYAEYQAYLQEHPDEWKMLDRLCDVTISNFFRDRKLWDFLQDQVMPELFENNEGTLSIWSAGCCNGEEAYSCAIIFSQLRETSEFEGEISILASDRNPEVLKRAQRGIYPGGALKELSDEEVKTWFHRREYDDEVKYVIRKQLTDLITFEHRDIRTSLPAGLFDLILCRNLVFTYFEKKEQIHFLDRLKYHLHPKGYLIIGANENLPKIDWLQSVNKAHSVWRRKD